MGAFTELFNSLKEIVVSNFVGIVIGWCLCSWLTKPKQHSGGTGGAPMGGSPNGMPRPNGSPNGIPRPGGLPQGGFPNRGPGNGPNFR